MNSLREFIDNFDFFANAALGGMLAGTLLGMLGTYIVLKKMVFLSAALSHISGAGIATAFFLQTTVTSTWMKGVASPDLFAAIAALITIFGISGRKSRTDATIPIAMVYLLGAGATLMIGTRIVAEIHDIQSLLFGNAVLVSKADFNILIALLISVSAVHFWFFRGFEITTYDYEMAVVHKMPAAFLQFVLLFTIAVAISMTTRILGALPVFAFSVLPAVAARHMAKNLLSMMILSAFFGALAGFFGYVVAYVGSFPVGATQATTALFIALCVIMIHRSMRFVSKIQSKITATEN